MLDDDPAYSLFEALELGASLSQLALESDVRCPAEVKRELRRSTMSRLNTLIGQLEAAVDDDGAVTIMRVAYGGRAR